MKNYSIQYNGDTGETYGVFLYDYPEISTARKNYEMYRVPGRNGELISSEEYLDNITVSCKFSIIGEKFMQVIRAVRRWLSGTGNLVLFDTPESFYEVLKIEYGSIERELRKYGRFTVVFTCYPYEFMNDGQMEVELPLYNPYNRCMPLFTIRGEGKCTLTVNGADMTANVGQNLTIDTRRQIAYREDGELMNTSVIGDYEKLWLVHGDNNVSIAEGFELIVVPRWGYDA